MYKAASASPSEKLFSPEEALASILRHVVPLGGEVVELSAALHRILRTPVTAGRPLPPWDNSAMDGYAVRAAEIEPQKPLPVHGVIAAGHAATAELAVRTTMRIMTGAPLPQGADAVIMREEATEQDGVVRFTTVPTVGQHVRRAGEDIADGEAVLPVGAELGPGELGLLAALGRTLVEVGRRPEVAIVSTGDELVAADGVPRSGQIVNSNAHALYAQVLEAGGRPRVLPIARDDRVALAVAFTEALRADVVVSSGGVSVGEFDYVREVLSELSVVEEFSRVAMKPGKPLTFSRFAPVYQGDQRSPSGQNGQQTLVFGLPGNPASSMVSFELFVRPALRRMQGFTETARPRVSVQLVSPVATDRSRLHFARARVRRDAESGALYAEVPEKQGSGMLRSMVGVNALLHVPPGSSPLAAGQTVWASLLGAV